MANTTKVPRIEANGVKGMKSVSWRRTFRNAEALLAWAEKNDAEILGTRNVETTVYILRTLRVIYVGGRYFGTSAIRSGSVADYLQSQKMTVESYATEAEALEAAKEIA